MRAFFPRKTRSLSQLRIRFNHGILNSTSEALETTRMFSDWAGGTNFVLAYNSTEGLIGDLDECYQGLKGKFIPPMGPTLKKWDNFFDKIPNGYYFHVCTSGGAITSKNCLQIYPPERRSRITVLAISPAAYIDPHLCRDVLHLLSEGDPLVKHVFSKFECNKEFMNRNNPHVVWLPVHPLAWKGFDHFSDSPTFRRPSQDFLHEFINQIRTNR